MGTPRDAIAANLATRWGSHEPTLLLKAKAHLESSPVITVISIITFSNYSSEFLRALCPHIQCHAAIKNAGGQEMFKNTSLAALLRLK